MACYIYRYRVNKYCMDTNREKEDSEYKFSKI